MEYKETRVNIPLTLYEQLQKKARQYSQRNPSKRMSFQDAVRILMHHLEEEQHS